MSEWVKINQMVENQPNFYNGFVSWFETFYQIVAHVTWHLSQGEKKDVIWDTQLDNGQIAIAHMCRNWTDEFEKLHKGEGWIDKDYYDEIDNFYNSKLNEEDNQNI